MWRTLLTQQCVMIGALCILSLSINSVPSAQSSCAIRKAPLDSRTSLPFKVCRIILLPSTSKASFDATFHQNIASLFAITMATVPISKSEKSYIQSSLLLAAPLRADGRALHDYRTVSLETGVAPLSNGSAKVNIGKSPEEGGGGTEILAATKLEVESIESGAGVEGGRIACTVTWYECLLVSFAVLTSSERSKLSSSISASISKCPRRSAVRLYHRSTPNTLAPVSAPE